MTATPAIDADTLRKAHLFLPRGASDRAEWIWQTRKATLSYADLSRLQSTIFNGIYFGVEDSEKRGKKADRRLSKVPASVAGSPFFFQSRNLSRKERLNKKTGELTPAAPPHTIEIWVETPPGWHKKIIDGTCSCEEFFKDRHCCHLEAVCLVCQEGIEANEPHDDNRDHSEDAIRRYLVERGMRVVADPDALTIARQTFADIAASNSFATAAPPAPAPVVAEPVRWEDRTPVSAATRANDWN